MKATMPTEATRQKVVTAEQVEDALKSLETSVQRLERVVLSHSSAKTDQLNGNSTEQKIAE